MLAASTGQVVFGVWSLVLGAALVFLLFVCMSLSLHISRLEAKTEILAEEIAMLHGVREPQPDPGDQT
jgi:hypothetical protein